MTQWISLFRLSWLALLFALPAYAEKRVMLFLPNGQPHPQYDTLIENLKPGDTAVFGEGGPGREFVLGNELSAGSRGRRSLIFDIGNGEALRIPQRSDDRSIAAMNWYFKAYQKLHSAGVHTVRVSPHSSPPQFLIVEKLEIEFDLNHFIEQYDKSNGAALPEAAKALATFATSTWRMENIGDFRPEQLVYTKQKRWVLLDFSGGGTPARQAQSPNALRAYHLRTANPDIRTPYGILVNDLSQQIEDTRKRNGLPGKAVRCDPGQLISGPKRNNPIPSSPRNRPSLPKQ